MITEIVQKASLNVVRVDVKVRGEWGNGSGLIIDEKGSILTCDHIIHPNGLQPEDILVTQQNGLPKKTEVSNFDEYHDLAMLKVKDLENRETMTRINYDDVKVGQDCFVLGYPLGLTQLTLAKGIISAKGKGLLNKLLHQYLVSNSSKMHTENVYACNLLSRLIILLVKNYEAG